MFSFFVKKRFLPDYLEGFVDIHNHILPGIDDGAKSSLESIKLIKGLSQFGITNFVCTPHIMNNFYPNTPETILGSFKNLKDVLVQNKMTEISISPSAEHMIDDNFEHLLESDQVMTLRDNYLLIEMSYLQPSINFNESVEKISRRHLYSILAHPERYVYLHDDKRKYGEYKKMGVLFQVNMFSLCGYYGKKIQKVALKLLEENMLDFIATDIHNTTHLRYFKNHLTMNKKTLDLIMPVVRNTIEHFYQN